MHSTTKCDVKFTCGVDCKNDRLESPGENSINQPLEIEAIRSISSHRYGGHGKSIFSRDKRPGQNRRLTQLICKGSAIGARGRRESRSTDENPFGSTLCARLAACV